MPATVSARTAEKRFARDSTDKDGHEQLHLLEAIEGELNEAQAPALAGKSCQLLRRAIRKGHKRGRARRHVAGRSHSGLNEWMAQVQRLVFLRRANRCDSSFPEPLGKQR